MFKRHPYLTRKEHPMTKRFVVSLILFITVAICVSAQEAEQPLKRAKVGDYAVFKMSGAGVNGTSKQEVTAVTDKEVTIRFTSTVNGIEQKPTEQKIDFTKKADPAVEAANRKKFKIVDTGKGQETLKIDGKDYQCDWRSSMATATQNGMDIVTESKLWMSKDAPVFGLVKTESKTFGQVTVVELTEAGSKR
jgi:hypothetical protein